MDIEKYFDWKNENITHKRVKGSISTVTEGNSTLDSERTMQYIDDVLWNYMLEIYTISLTNAPQ